jgi:hypothetical protein
MYLLVNKIRSAEVEVDNKIKGIKNKVVLEDKDITKNVVIGFVYS